MRTERLQRLADDGDIGARDQLELIAIRQNQAPSILRLGAAMGNPLNAEEYMPMGGVGYGGGFRLGDGFGCGNGYGSPEGRNKGSGWGGGSGHWSYQRPGVFRVGCGEYNNAITGNGEGNSLGCSSKGGGRSPDRRGWITLLLALVVLALAGCVDDVDQDAPDVGACSGYSASSIEDAGSLVVTIERGELPGVRVLLEQLGGEWLPVRDSGAALGVVSVSLPPDLVCLHLDDITDPCAQAASVDGLWCLAEASR